MKLSKLKKLMMRVEYNTIFIIVDRLIKQAYFILFLEKAGAEEIVYIFYKYITENYKISEEIISDQNMRFRFKFWQELIILTEIKNKLSTVFHLQIDRITE